MPSRTKGGEHVLSLYRRLLRSAAAYPSRNRMGIYQSIRGEFRENAVLDPMDTETKKKLEMAHKGLIQLRQFDESAMTGSNSGSTNWKVSMETNPMPAPPNYERKW